MARLSLHLGMTWLGAFTASALGIFYLAQTPPQAATGLGLTWLYFLIFLVFACLTSGLGYALRTVIFPNGHRLEIWRVSRRQGIWLGLLAAAALFLQGNGILTPLIGILLLTMFFLIELYVR